MAENKGHQKPAAPKHAAPAPETERRNFFIRAAATVIGAAVALVPLGAALFAFFDPVTRKEKDWAGERGMRPSNNDGFIRVARLNELAPAGEPKRFQVIDHQTDKWTFTPDQPIGSVFLTLQSEGGDIRPLNTTCPHAGCSVKLGVSKTTGKDAFLCPCHNSTFELDGAMIQPTPSPRPLDDLPCEVRNGDEVWVKFQDFYTGKAAKVAKG